jgi:outer membrane protein OmpA-like peptidoglycan-associated protein
VTSEGVIGEQVCAQKVRPGSFRPTVFRATKFRPNVYRPIVFRKPVRRPAVCKDGDCIPAVLVPGIAVQGVTVPGVVVDGDSLDGRRLPEIHSRCVSVLTGKKTTAYLVCTDVLFAFDRADIRPAAQKVLREVAASIRRRFPDGPIQVDGHTDAKGSPTYNQGLSERRANAVARWLTEQGNIDESRLTVRGYGETQPVAANTRADGSDNPEGRRKNRRVVVGVTKP